jgi:hypothetical protein
LVNEQFAFRVNSSTNKGTCKLLNEGLIALNNKLLVGGMFYDEGKAFDYVNLNILLSKLEFCGIIGRTHKLIKFYVEDRFQIVEIVSNVLHNTATSGWHRISCGVPQGSILGPLLCFDIC